jgi:hypothetical protein
MVQGPGEFGEGVGADAGVLCEDGGRGSRWSQADHLAAVFGPGQGEGAHGDCFPCASRGERKLQTCPGVAHLADHGRLPGIKGSPIRRHFEQGQIHRRLFEGRTAALSGGCDEALLGVEDSRRCVEGGAGDGVRSSSTVRLARPRSHSRQQS